MNSSSDHRKNLLYQNRTDSSHFGVHFIRNTYILLAVLFTISSLIRIIFFVLERNHLEDLKVVFPTIIFWFIVYGISKTKRWIVVFILLCSYFWLAIGSITFYYTKPSSHFELFQKLVQFVYLVFVAFQIYIFSKKETKCYFNDKGKTLIS